MDLCPVKSTDDELECGRPATMSVLRGRRRVAEPRCQDHARYEALLAERYGYGVVLTARGAAVQVPEQRTLW